MKFIKVLSLAVIMILVIALILILQIYLSTHLFFGDVPGGIFRGFNSVVKVLPLVQYESILREFIYVPIALSVILLSVFLLVKGIPRGLNLSGIGIMVSALLLVIMIMLFPKFYNEKKIGRILIRQSSTIARQYRRQPMSVYNSYSSTLLRTGYAAGGAGLLIFGAGLIILAIRRKGGQKKKTHVKKKTASPGNSKKPLFAKRTKAQREAEKKRKEARKKQEKAKKEQEALEKAAAKRRAREKPLKAYLGIKPFIFISYAHKNNKAVYKVLHELHNNRSRLWYDEGIEAGEEWPEIVGNRIRKCRYFLVFMSRAANNSRNVRNEINFALKENKKIVVVNLESTKLSDGLQLQIGSVQHIEKYNTKNRDFIKKLISVLT